MNMSVISGLEYLLDHVTLRGYSQRPTILNQKKKKKKERKKSATMHCTKVSFPRRQSNLSTALIMFTSRGPVKSLT